MMVRLLLVVIMLLALMLVPLSGGQAQRRPRGFRRRDKYEVRPPKLKKTPFKKMYEIIYPFYSKPQYRYPFYDHHGNGELLYGYGTSKLYRYTVFKPVEGYHKK